MLTSYDIAVNWLHNSFILCNNIQEIDPSIFDNLRFPLFYYVNENEDEVDEDYDGEIYGRNVDIYQFYLTSCSESDVEYLEKHFGLLFTYSDMLDLFVLCVNHFGTMWSSVTIDTDLEYAAKEYQKRSR